MRQRGTIIKHFTRKKTHLHTLFFDYMFDKKKEKKSAHPEFKEQVTSPFQKIASDFSNYGKRKIMQKTFYSTSFSAKYATVVRYCYLPRRFLSSGVMIASILMFFVAESFCTNSLLYFFVPRGMGCGCASPMRIIFFIASLSQS